MEALWMQNKPLGYNADLDRQLFANLYTEGVLGAGFVATQRAAGANMSVDLTGGVGVVTGDDTSGQGRYLIIEPAPVTNVPIGAAPLSGTRHDLIVARVNDEHGGGAPSNDAGFVRIPGVTDGVDPAVPATALMLWRVRVPAGTVSITDDLIDDLRIPSRLAHEVVGNAAIASSAVTTSKIGDSQVTAAKLAAGAVTTAKIADAAVTSAKIANEAVGHDQLQPGGVTNTKIGTNAVSETKIGAQAVTEAKLATAVLSSAWATLSAGGSWSGTIRYKKIGNVVFLNLGTGLSWDGSNGVSTAASAIATLPAGFRPSVEVRIVGANDTNTSAQLFNITTGGVITKLGIGTSGAVYAGSGVFGV